MKSIKSLCRQVVIALKGGGGSGKTSSLRKLYHDLIGTGAVLMDSDSVGTKNLRRYYLAYERWRVVICEGGDSADIICENFDWANTVTVTERLSCGNKIRDLNHWNWDIIVMPAWTNMYSRDSQDVQGCVGALLQEVWDKKYALEIVDRAPAPSRETAAAKIKSQADCAKRLKQRIDFVIADRFTY